MCACVVARENEARRPVFFERAVRARGGGAVGGGERAHPIRQVGRLAGANAGGLGRRVDRDEDDGALLDGASMSVEKKRLRPRASSTTSCEPRLVDGQVVEFHAAMRRSLRSHTVTLMSGHLRR